MSPSVKPEASTLEVPPPPGSIVTREALATLLAALEGLLPDCCLPAGFQASLEAAWQARRGAGWDLPEFLVQCTQGTVQLNEALACLCCQLLCCACRANPGVQEEVFNARLMSIS